MIIDIQNGSHTITEIVRWLEDYVGYELTDTQYDIVHNRRWGDGWQMKMSRFDFTYGVDFIKVDIDDSKKYTIFKLRWS